MATRKAGREPHQPGARMQAGRAVRPATEPCPPSDETYRGTMQGHTPDGEPTTVIVTRQGLGRAGRAWLTLDGAIRTTVVMDDEQAGQLVELVNAARGRR